MTERIRALWHGLATRERVLIALASAIIALGATLMLWRPIEQDLASTRRELDALLAQSQSLRRSVDEIAELRRSARNPRTADARAGAEATIASRGLRPSLTSVDTVEGRLRITFASIDTAALAGLLDALGREEQLFVREGTLAARIERGTVRAELTLVRPERR